jgi:hypothetical protein
MITEAEALRIARQRNHPSIPAPQDHCPLNLGTCFYCRSDADLILQVQAETAKECAEMLDTSGVLLPIVPGETKSDQVIRFAHAFANKIRAKFGVVAVLEIEVKI